MRLHTLAQEFTTRHFAHGVIRMFAKLRKFAKNESGATAIEYGLIAALVSIAGITAMIAMGESLEEMFETVSEELNNAVA